MLESSQRQLTGELIAPHIEGQNSSFFLFRLRLWNDKIKRECGSINYGDKPQLPPQL
jgi:hypothetical protein